MEGVWFIPPFVFVFTCSSCQNCFDVICLKVTWICKRVDFHVFGFQGQPRDTDVASPILDIKRLQGILACVQPQVSMVEIGSINAVRGLAQC